MTCKNCIHFDVCFIVKEDDEERNLKNSPCKTFKDKSLVLDLPCKVGDTLWVLWSLTKAQKKEVYPVEAYALRYDDKKNNMRVCVEGRFKIEKYDGYYTHFYRGTFSWESVGKTVFLTREAAEQALKERDMK